MAEGEPQQSLTRPRLRAVIVDGSSDWSPLASALLKLEECVELVARVEDGQQAIEAVSALHPELLIMDLGIGSIDALTTTSLLCHQFPSLVVILVASRNTPSLCTACHSAGAKHLIHKARFHEELRQILVEIESSLGMSRG